MNRTSGLLLGLLALGAAAGADEPRPGDVPREIKPSRSWRGSVADLELQKKAPPGGVITDRKTFAELHTAWMVGGDLPKVDFTRELVLVGTTRGSRMNVDARLNKEGDLQVGFITTDDLREGFRYLMVALPRAGVKSIGGKKLMKGTN
jgi:hypothetical protein